MLRRLLDRELGVARHNDRLGRPPQRIYLLQRPIRAGTRRGPQNPCQIGLASSGPPADTARFQCLPADTDPVPRVSGCHPVVLF